MRQKVFQPLFAFILKPYDHFHDISLYFANIVYLLLSILFSQFLIYPYYYASTASFTINSSACLERISSATIATPRSPIISRSCSAGI